MKYEEMTKEQLLEILRKQDEIIKKLKYKLSKLLIK